jgi:hypothetical protein
MIVIAYSLVAIVKNLAEKGSVGERVPGSRLLSVLSCYVLPSEGKAHSQPLRNGATADD